MFGVTGAGMNKIKNMQSGGKRHRWSVDQWDKVGRPQPPNVITISGTAETNANTLTAKYDRPVLSDTAITEHDTDTCLHSDGSRQETHRVPARTNRQPDSAPWIRAKQPLESTCSPTGRIYPPKLTHTTRSRDGSHKVHRHISYQRAVNSHRTNSMGSLAGTWPCTNAKFVSVLDSYSDPREACRPGIYPDSTCTRSACSFRAPAEQHRRPWRHRWHS